MLNAIKHSLAHAQRSLPHLSRLGCRPSPVFRQVHRRNLLTSSMFRLYASGIEHSFAARAAGQTKLKEFMKFVHPDLLSGASDAIRQVNTQSVQEMNEVLTLLKSQTTNKGMQAKTLRFHVLKEGSKD